MRAAIIAATLQTITQAEETGISGPSNTPETFATIQDLIQRKRFTVILGKNGSGKSTLLREIDPGNAGNIKYISPERGGTLKYDANIDTNMSNDPNWLPQTRRRNRFEQFRQQSAAQLRNLEVVILREIEKDLTKRRDETYTFESILERINRTLPAIRLTRSNPGCIIQTKNGTTVPEESISSGESELLSLAIEILVFSRLDATNKILLLDEPDVHLHPDLQEKFVSLIEEIAVDRDFRVVIATHSTAIIGAFSSQADLNIVPITAIRKAGYQAFDRTEVCEEILPIFGPHALSSAFNRIPLILVEGEDDRRVLEQIGRSSNPKIKLAPCIVGTENQFIRWENWLNQFLPSIYDDPKAYSLRDLDDSPSPDINDEGCLIRARLNCYSIENILLSEECLADHGLDELTLLEKLRKWASDNPNHKYHNDSIKLIERFGERRTTKIKNIRNIITGDIFETNKQWEIVVGQSIAKHHKTPSAEPNSIRNYLGAKFLSILTTAE